MGKSKKRSRTRALYEAAANAAAAANKAKKQQRCLLDDNDDDDDDIVAVVADDESKNNDEKETTSTPSPPTLSDIATTIKTIQYLTTTNGETNLDLFNNSKQYKELRKVMHPLIVQRIESYSKGIDYIKNVTLHLSNHRWTQALGSLRGVKDYKQQVKQGTIQRWVRDVDSCDDNSNKNCNSKIKIKLLSSILNCTNTNANVNANFNTNVNTNFNTTNVNGNGNGITNGNKNRNHDKTSGGETTATISNKHDPLSALIAAQKNNNNININIDDDEYDDEYEDDYDEDEKKGGLDDNNNNKTDDDDELKILKGWKIPSLSISSSSSDDSTSTSTSNSNSNSNSLLLSKLSDLNSQIVYREKSSERTPPNHYDLILHHTTTTTTTTTAACTTATPTPTADDNKSEEEPDRVITKYNIPFLNNGHSGAFVLENVLSPKECNQLIEVSSTKLGYQKDHPLTLKEPTGIDSCEWYISNDISNLIYKRVYKYLPKKSNNIMSNISNTNDDTASADDDVGGEEEEEEEEEVNSNNGGNILSGINRRWRFFRYGQGCVYRPHIDGSWPDSRLTKIKVKKDNNNNNTATTTGNDTSYEYKYEVDKTGNTRSYLTFLIYLNDNFDGGETKFYYPVSTTTSTNNDNDNEKTSLVARGVIPKRGSVLVFPQGNTASLLHEGSAVTKGIKYVIRTDVLYQHNK